MLRKPFGHPANRCTTVPERRLSSETTTRTSLRLSNAHDQPGSRLSNDLGNVDPCAPPGKTFPLKSIKTPQEFREFADGEKLPDMNEIRATTKAHFSAMDETERALGAAEKNKKASAKNKPARLYTLLENSEFAAMVDRTTGVLKDPATGLCCMLQPLNLGEFGEVETYALCFPGFGDKEMMSVQLSTCVQQFLGVGGVPPMYRRALDLVTHLNQALVKKNERLQLTGHSMGGGVANYVGIKLGLPSACFNAAALGRACMKDIGQVNMASLIDQKHIRFEDDFATHPSALRKLITFFTLGSKTYVPRNVGAIYEIKTSDKSYPSHHDWLGRHLLDSFNDWYHQLPLSKRFS